MSLSTMPTEEQAKRITQSVFIDSFDPDKYNIKNYKIIIIIGSGLQPQGLVNGLPLEEKCIFIPYLEEERDINKREIAHVAYLYYALKRFTFGVEGSSLNRLLSSPLSYGQDAYSYIVPLLMAGHAVLYEITTHKKSPKTIFYYPKGISDLQFNTVEKIVLALSKNKYSIGIGYIYNDNNICTYYSNAGKDLFLPDDLTSILKDISSGKNEHNNVLT